MSKRSRLLVVDASVMRSAGGRMQSRSATCSQVLDAIFNICHRVAVSSEITEEWNQHQSNFARKWRRSMVAKKKLVPVGTGNHTNELRTRIRMTPNVGDKDSEALLKDAHLLAAAQAADRVLISNDAALQGLCKKHGLVQDVEWINIDAYTLEGGMTPSQRLEQLAQFNPSHPRPIL